MLRVSFWRIQPFIPRNRKNEPTNDRPLQRRRIVGFGLPQKSSRDGSATRAALGVSYRPQLAWFNRIRNWLVLAAGWQAMRYSGTPKGVEDSEAGLRARASDRRFSSFFR